jgi:mono/diheme cytochrome c family protein
MFKKIVNVIEVLALVAALGFVIALFTNGSGPSASGTSYGPRSGIEIFAASCAVCHGDDGQGGVGPQLNDGAVVAAYPKVQDQVKVVEDGKGGGQMPSFAGQLSTQEITAVVDYTRTELG